MIGFAFTVVSWLGDLAIWPEPIENWLGRTGGQLITALHFRQLPAERQRQLRRMSRQQLINALRTFRLDPASGWLRHFTPEWIEKDLQHRTRIELLDEVGYCLPGSTEGQPAGSPPVSGSS